MEDVHAFVDADGPPQDVRVEIDVAAAKVRTVLAGNALCLPGYAPRNPPAPLAKDKAAGQG